MIYLDYAANYPTKKEVLDYLSYIELNFPGNYNSNHPLGEKSKKLYKELNENIYHILGISKRQYEIIYTSSATESNNLAIKGVAKSYSGFGRKILVSELEHSSVNGCLGELKNEGFIIDFIKTHDNGEIDQEDLKAKLTDDVILVCIILVDGETGFMHDYKTIQKIVKSSRNAKLLIDATQAVGKFKLELNDLDLVSFTPHKFGGLIGTGVLLRNKDIILSPIINGGESNTIYRSGTVPLGLIGTIYKSLDLAYENMDKNYRYVLKLNRYFMSKLKNIKELQFNSFSNPYFINISIKNKPSYKTIEYFNKHNICVSQKSACSVFNTPSKIINSIYKDKQRAASSIRITISDMTTYNEIDEFIRVLEGYIKK